MIIKWLQSLVLPKSSEGLAKPAFEKQVPEASPDIPHEALVREAAHKHKALQGLEQRGRASEEKRLLRQVVKGKVTRHLTLVEESSEALAEEVTDVLADASENDPVFRRMFDDSDKKL